MHCRAALAQAYHTTSVLFEVLCALDRKAKPEEKVAPEDLEAGQKLQEKAAEIIPYNILPLDAAGGSLALMQLPEVRVTVLCNLREICKGWLDFQCGA